MLNTGVASFSRIEISTVAVQFRTPNCGHTGTHGVKYSPLRFALGKMYGSIMRLTSGDSWEDQFHSYKMALCIILGQNLVS